jgi:predicted RND superfamily exporter protein
VRVALVSVVPNLVPVAACFVAMRSMGLDLRIETSLVLCVSVGGLFNTTIHIAARILQQRRSGATDPDAIIRNALRAVGPPSLYTAAGLSAGFAVMCISNFVALRALGLLCAVTFVSAFVADAVVTPSLMRTLLRGPHSKESAAPDAPVAEVQRA